MGMGCKNYINGNFGIVLFDVYYCHGEFLINKEQVIKITSIIAILGAINIPIIKFSVDWWSTLHQGASVNQFYQKSTIHSIYVNTFG